MARVSPGTLKAYIRDDYDAAAPGWEPFMGPYFRVPAERLVADLAPRRGDRCLDLACGSGLVARAFAVRAGAACVSACDFAPLQVREARGVLDAAGMPEIEVRVMDAERITYPPGSFERVGCGFGFNHFPRPLVALRERFDERLLDLVPAVGESGAAFETAFGRLSGRNGRPERIVELLARAGFVGVEHRSHRFAADYVDAPTFVDAMLARAERDLRQANLGDTERVEVREALVADLSRFGRQEFVVRRTFHTVIGRRVAG
jgi:SAM-dependent methyltransferase